jgi:1-deoxy-D-xylulose-5-phosphate reductoisomerase
MKRLCILGATGSIGGNTLEIVRRFPDRFSVTAVSARGNLSALASIIAEFRPAEAVVFDRERADDLAQRLPSDSGVRILYGTEGLCEAAAGPEVDAVVTAVVGAAGLQPTLAAVDAGKEIALANKETLVMAGDLVMDRAKKTGAPIRPVDSEHSAIFQCLAGQRRADLSRILLTASGGPFRETPADKMTGIRPADALNHPNWEMGPKITVDSATLMNKGLEVIEAIHLFGVSRREIEVVVHPQSIVHSMVEMVDGSVIAQMGVPDMKGAIALALSWPERLPLGEPAPDFPAIGTLTFQRPDLDRFPCLGLAFAAGEAGGTHPAVLNAANEVAVGAFLYERIPFPGIAEAVGETLSDHRAVAQPDLSAILDADTWARRRAEQAIDRIAGNSI